MWKSHCSTWDFQDYDQDFQNSDPGSQDFLFQKVSASNVYIYMYKNIVDKEGIALTKHTFSTLFNMLFRILIIFLTQQLLLGYMYM